MKVIIGVDPHKASHQAVAIDDREIEIDRISVKATRTQAQRLLTWSAPFDERMWAVEGAGGLGYLLAQQLVEAGETVVDVPATLAARARVLASGRSNKTEPNDAWSVAITALRHGTLRRIQPASHTEVPRLLAKATPTSAISAAGSCRVFTRCSSSSRRAESPRKSTVLTSTGSSPRSRP